MRLGSKAGHRPGPTQVTQPPPDGFAQRAVLEAAESQLDVLKVQ